MITNPQHFIVESPHPSPLSAFRGFFGSRPFSQVNAFLERTGQEPINWQLPNL
jgi:uracil-DNA glycosylase